MGNKNSSQKKNVEQDDPGKQVQDIHDRSAEIYKSVWGNKPDNCVEKRFEIFVGPDGSRLPYESKNILGSESPYASPMSSENPRYIELVICKDDIHQVREKYAVHKGIPNHDCGKNCKCINGDCEMYKSVFSPSPRSSIGPKKDFSPTSSDVAVYEIRQIGSVSPDARGLKKFSPTSTEPRINSAPRQFSPTSSEDNVRDIDVSEFKQLIGGASNDDQRSKKKKSNLDDTDDEDEDDDDEDLEDIEEDDITTEEGFKLDKNGIRTSELYEMQKRIFSSSDSDDVEDTVQRLRDLDRDSERRIENRDRENRGLDDDQEMFSDRVRRELKRMGNNRSKIFNSEDRAILDMNSPSEKYMKRSTRKNEKYQ